MKNSEHPFKPSWIDRFNDWMGSLSVHQWLPYLVFSLVLLTAQLVFLYWEDGFGSSQLFPIIIFNSIATPYAFMLVHFLDQQSTSCLETIRPILDLDDIQIRDYRYKLSTMPWLQPLIAGMVLVLAVVVMELISPVPVRYQALEQLPFFSVIYHIVDKSSAFMYGVIIYHTIRQLRIVNDINTNHARIDLFNLKPARAFARLTAQTAAGLLVGIYLWMLINPDLLDSPLSLAGTIAFTLLAVVVFMWPLVGVHHLMNDKKETSLQDIDSRFEKVLVEFNDRLDKGDQEGIEKLNGVISSLNIQRERIHHIPTWPWSSNTAQLFLTAIALPLVLMVLRYLVEQTLQP